MTTTIQPEFCRRVPVSRIGPGGLDQAIEANQSERLALAARLQIPSIASLSCRFRLSPEGGGRLAAAGELCAELTRICVVSLEPFETVVRERFALRFVPEEPQGEDLDPDSPDELPYDADSIDLGEAATEQLALSLDPYPRMPGIASLPTEATEPASGGTIETDERQHGNPFAALRRLRPGAGSGEA